MSLANSDSAPNFSAGLENVITAISRSPDTDEPASFQQIEDFSNHLAEMSATNVPALRDLAKPARIWITTTAKIAIDDLLKAALDLVRAERTSRIEKLPVSQKRIDDLASAIENNVFGENAHTFPLCKISINPGGGNLTESEILKIKNYEKGCFTDPRMFGPVLNEQESFSGAVAKKINACF